MRHVSTTNYLIAVFTGMMAGGVLAIAMMVYLTISGPATFHCTIVK